MAETVAGRLEPAAGLRGPPIAPGRRPLPQVLRRMIKVQDPRRIGGKILLKHAPQPPCAITEPDHPGCVRDALADGGEPQTRLERLNVPQDRHQAALMQAGHDLPGPGAMLPQPGQHPHFDFAPGGFALRRARPRPQGDHHPIRIRGEDERGVGVSRARVYVCAHQTKRFIVARTCAEEERDRSLSASARSGRTLALVQGHRRRWLVEVVLQDGKAQAGGSQGPKQPGEAGARHSVILSLRVEHALCWHRDQHAQRTNTLPASTVGSLRAPVPVAGLGEVIAALGSADAPQEKLTRFTQALHAVFALRRSTKHLLQRPWGRLASTPSLHYRADEVMRHMPVMST